MKLSDKCLPLAGWIGCEHWLTAAQRLPSTDKVPSLPSLHCLKKIDGFAALQLQIQYRSESAPVACRAMQLHLAALDKSM